MREARQTFRPLTKPFVPSREGETSSAPLLVHIHPSGGLKVCSAAVHLQHPSTPWPWGPVWRAAGRGLAGSSAPLSGHPFSPTSSGRPGTRPQLTLMEAPANRASCLMCCPFFPMMAPTACVGMNKLTTSCSGSWRGEQSEGFSLILSSSLSPLPSAPPQALKSPARYATPSSIPALGTAGRGHPTGDAGGGGLTGCWCGKAPTGEAPYSPERYAEELCGRRGARVSEGPAALCTLSPTRKGHGDTPQLMN